VSPTASPALATPTLVATQTSTASMTLPTQTAQVQWGGPLLLTASLSYEHYIVDQGNCSEERMLNVGVAQRQGGSVYGGCPSCEALNGTANSVYNRGRLGETGWYSGEATSGHYLLKFPVDVTFVGIGITPASRPAPPRGPTFKWVKDLSLAVFGLGVGTPVDGGKVFEACRDEACRKYIRFDAPVRGTILRIDVVGWEWWPAMCVAPVLCGSEVAVQQKITVTFSEPTLQGLNAVDSKQPPSSSAVDTLLEVVDGTFGSSAGYSGVWTSSSSFVVTLTTAFDGEITPGVTSFRLAKTAGISSVAGNRLSLPGADIPLQLITTETVFATSPQAQGFTKQPPSSGARATGWLIIMGCIVGAIAFFVLLFLLVWCLMYTCTRRNYVDSITDRLNRATEYHKARQVPSTPTSPPANPINNAFPPPRPY